MKIKENSATRIIIEQKATANLVFSLVFGVIGAGLIVAAFAVHQYSLIGGGVLIAMIFGGIPLALAQSTIWTIDTSSQQMTRSVKTYVKRQSDLQVAAFSDANGVSITEDYTLPPGSVMAVFRNLRVSFRDGSTWDIGPDEQRAKSFGQTVVPKPSSVDDIALPLANLLRVPFVGIVHGKWNDASVAAAKDIEAKVLDKSTN